MHETLFLILISKPSGVLSSIYVGHQIPELVFAPWKRPLSLIRLRDSWMERYNPCALPSQDVGAWDQSLGCSSSSKTQFITSLHSINPSGFVK